ncbi:ferredoxin [Streptomyces sp. NPDC052676]|uniref:ferredoxin n=1 Tax=Streptomyces sp. NPDC052676 TaxID=3154953 RepID=UPI0034120601
MSGQWQITVHKSCRRSGICAAAAPRWFTVGDDHRTRPVAGPVDPDPELLDVADSCPAEAITVTDLVTGAPVTEAPEAVPPPRESKVRP